MSVLFKHACRYELFDRNPIRFVRQSAKRRTAPTLLAPMEIKMLVEGLGLQGRTSVLLAALFLCCILDYCYKLLSTSWQDI
jgi:hypothetical protein